MRRTIRLKESELRHMISESVRKMLKETDEDWYAEEDYDGKTGQVGEVRSYNIGYYGLSNAEADAEENGYDDVAEWLKAWFFEIQPDCPWYWQTLGNGYGYHGDTIFRENNIVCKDIYGQIMIDEYSPNIQENVIKRIKDKFSRKKEKDETDSPTKAYYREHTKFYKPRGWDRYLDKKGNFDFEKWWNNG